MLFFINQEFHLNYEFSISNGLKYLIAFKEFLMELKIIFRRFYTKSSRTKRFMASETPSPNRFIVT